MPPREGVDALSPASRAYVDARRSGFAGPSFMNFNYAGDNAGFPAANYGGGGGGVGNMDPETQQRLLQMMFQFYQNELAAKERAGQARTPQATMEAAASTADPIGWANKQLGVQQLQRQGDIAGRTFNYLTPEQRLASQGRSAENMWAQQGGRGVDPEELKKQNMLRAASQRYYGA